LIFDCDKSCVPKTSSALNGEGNPLTSVGHDRSGLLHLVGLDGGG
jgi:hypothetical protein